jgi:outer membrane receptor protein involved in Fe transport
LVGSGAFALDAADMGLEDEFALLEEQDVVFSAARHKQKTGFSPSSVIVITKEEIEESGALTLIDLLRRYPAVYAYEHDPLYPAADIRGSIRVLLLIDGREVNLEFFVAPFFAALPVGLQTIERIEVVLGPNSALYGADAVSAVINVITSRPSGDLHADVALAAGEHGTTVVEGSLEGGAGPLAARATFGVDRADSWMDRGLGSKDLMRFNGVLRLRLPGGELLANGGLVAGAGRFFGVVGYFDFSEIFLSHAQVDLEISDLKVRAYWYGFRSKYDFDIGLIHPDLGELGTLPRFDTSGDTFQLGAQYDLSLFADNLLICGADGRVTFFQDDHFVDPDILEYRLGVFAHDEHRFADRVLLTLGVRFDYNSVTEAALSPRAAVVVSPGGEHFLRLSGGMAFRKPTLLESSINIKVNAYPAFPEIKEIFEVGGISDPGLSNEKLATLELGYRGALLDGSLRLQADLYFSSAWDNIGFRTEIHIEDTPLGPRIEPEQSRLGYDNIGNDYYILGINAGVAWEPDDDLALFARSEFRHQWRAEDRGRDLLVVRFQAAAGGTLRTPFGLTAHLAAVYTGGRSGWMRDPVSIMMPQVFAEAPENFYLLGALTYTLSLGSSRLDLGLSLFRPAAAPLREQTGVQAPDGSNYGGEYIGTRAILSARIRY